MKFPWLLIVTTLVIQTTSAVDREAFKTCAQSGFCQRLRETTPGLSPYAVDVDTVVVTGNVLTANVKAVDHGTEWQYVLKLSALTEGTFRVELDETAPLYPRYRTQQALDGEPEIDGLSVLSNENGKVILANSQGHRVVITADPLKLEMLDRSGEVTVVLNERAMLLVEPLRDGKGILANGQGHHVVITGDPLKLEVLVRSGEVAVVLNERRCF